MEIEILEQQCGGTEFVPSPHRLHPVSYTHLTLPTILRV
mgnify:CR=1 FL=1